MILSAGTWWGPIHLNSMVGYQVDDEPYFLRMGLNGWKSPKDLSIQNWLASWFQGCNKTSPACKISHHYSFVGGRFSRVVIECDWDIFKHIMYKEIESGRQICAQVLSKIRATSWRHSLLNQCWATSSIPTEVWGCYNHPTERPLMMSKCIGLIATAYWLCRHPIMEL